MGEPRLDIHIKRKDPNYNPYGTVYTDKQTMILDGVVPVETVRLSELAILVKKAEKMGDRDNAELARQLYEQKSNPESYFPPYSLGEAKAILQRLTPWKRA